MINTPGLAQPQDPQSSASPLVPRRNPTLVQRIAKRIFPMLPDYGPQEVDTNNTQTGLVSSMVNALWERYFKYEITRERIYKDVDAMDDASEEVSIALDTIASNICTSEEGQQVSFIVRVKGLQQSTEAPKPNKLMKQSGLQNEMGEENMDGPSQKSKITTAQAQKAQDVIDKTITTARLHQAVRPMARNLLKYGDAFSEIVINKKGEIVKLAQLPARTMQRNEDLKGNFIINKPEYGDDGKCRNKLGSTAFQQIDPDSNKVLAAFWPWQIVHTRLNWNGYDPYGKSMLRVSRLTWRRLKAIEETLIIGRMTRDLMKLVFHVDTTNLAPDQAAVVLQRFEESVTNKIAVGSKSEQPYSVMTDFFLNDGYVRVNGQSMPMRTRIESIDPRNEGLHNITDIQYIQRKLIATLWVPPAHLSFEQEINGKNTLGQQDVQYVRKLRDVQGLMSESLEQVFDTAFILAGIDPELVEYEISWPSLKAIDDLTAATAEKERALADAVYLGNSQQNGTPVIDPYWIMKHRLDMEDEEIEIMQSRMKAIQDEQDQADQDKQEQMFQRQIQLAKANKTGTADGKAKQDGNGGPPAGRKRPIAAENTMLFDTIKKMTTEIVAEDLEQIYTTQLDNLNLANDLADSMEALRFTKK